MKKDKQKRQIHEETQPLIIPEGSSSIQSDLGESGNLAMVRDNLNTQSNENKDTPPPPTMLTLAKEGFGWFTAGQIFSAVVNAGVGTMIATLAVEKLNDPTASDDDAYAKTLAAISIAAGIISVSITSYGFLRTEAYRLRAREKLGDVHEKAVEIKNSLNQPPAANEQNQGLEKENASLKRKLATSVDRQQELLARAEQAEARAERAEKQIASSSQLNNK